ncbi:MAG: IGHMBP2 family helicase, partial [Bacteroidetes bacterium]
MDSQTHLAQLEALLKIEKAEDARQYRETVLRRSRPERVQKGLSWYPIELRRVQVGLGERISIEVHRTTGPENSAFQVGTVVSFFGQRSDQEVGRHTGVVSALQGNMMRIALGTSRLGEWVPTAHLGVDLDFDDRTYQEMQKALKAVQAAKGESRLRELREVLRGGVKPEFREWKEVRYANPRLNASQNAAVQHVLEARDVAVIHGPPGTGKTTTLVAAIQEVLHHEHQVLVCAPSNTAVDLLTLRCSEQGIDVVRLGNPARVDESLQAHTLDGAIARHQDYDALRKIRKDAEKIQKQALKYKRKFGGQEAQRRRELLKEARELRTMAHKLEDYILHQVLSQSQVITATLTGAAGNILGSRRFHTLFIDEAAQALEPACWIPILRAERVVMAGDHCQLPPTVKSIEAEREGLGRTLFE